MSQNLRPTISCLIIARDEELMIAACISTVLWCDEILVIDTGSVDKTAQIAERFGAKVIAFSHPSFSRLREEALKRSNCDWVMYLDADERITPQLAKEIQVNIETQSAEIMAFNRRNVHFGHELDYGGWGEDVVERVFKRSAILGWSGEIHESPRFEGKAVVLKAKLAHFTHRDIVSGLFKSARWTPLEAKQLAAAKIPEVRLGTILRKGVMEFVRRAIFKKGYLDGQTGLVEALVQAINRMLVYLQVWEFQQKPTAAELYKQKELEIKKSWETNP